VNDKARENTNAQNRITYQETETMDELIEELREANQPVPIPLELPEEDDLVEVQEALFISLNEDFQQFMLTVSDVVYGTLEPVTASDPTSHTYLPEVAAIAWDAGLPRDLVPLCEHQGNYYAVTEEGEVQYWEGGVKTEQTWETIWYWARDVWLNS
jgi:hypothetical protein